MPTERYPGLFPIGRLDFDTTGLLLFSTDGELGNGLLHPKHHVTKRYLACVEGRPTERDLALLRRGIELDDGPTQPADVRMVEGGAARHAERLLEIPAAVPPRSSKEYAAVCEGRATRRSIVRLGIREGRKRQVKRMLAAVGHPVLALHRDSFGPLKRMLAAVGHPVLALHRDSFGPLELGDLPRGAWRALDAEEVAALHQAIGRAE